MAKFTFTSKSSSEKPVKQTPKKETVKAAAPGKKNVRVLLKKYEQVDSKPEFYSYINTDGETCKFSGIVSQNEDGTYLGKVITTHKVPLIWHPTVESVKHVDEYFSYIGDDEREHTFTGDPQYDIEKNVYIGLVTENKIVDEIVNIYRDEEE